MELERQLVWDSAEYELNARNGHTADSGYIDVQGQGVAQRTQDLFGPTLCSTEGIPFTNNGVKMYTDAIHIHEKTKPGWPMLDPQQQLIPEQFRDKFGFAHNTHLYTGREVLDGNGDPVEYHHYLARIRFDDLEPNKADCCSGKKKGAANCAPCYYPFSKACAKDPSISDYCAQEDPRNPGYPRLVTNPECKKWCKDTSNPFFPGQNNDSECNKSKRKFCQAFPDSKFCKCINQFPACDNSCAQEDLVQTLVPTDMDLRQCNTWRNARHELGAYNGHNGQYGYIAFKTSRHPSGVERCVSENEQASHNVGAYSTVYTAPTHCGAGECNPDPTSWRYTGWEAQRIVKLVPEYVASLFYRFRWPSTQKEKCCSGELNDAGNCAPCWYPFSKACAKDDSIVKFCGSEDPDNPGKPRLVTNPECQKWCKDDSNPYFPDTTNVTNCDRAKRLYCEQHPDSPFCYCMNPENDPEIQRLRQLARDKGSTFIMPQAASTCWYAGCAGADLFHTLKTSDMVEAGKSCPTQNIINCEQIINLQDAEAVEIYNNRFNMDCKLVVPEPEPEILPPPPVLPPPILETPENDPPSPPLIPDEPPAQEKPKDDNSSFLIAAAIFVGLIAFTASKK